MSDLVVGIIIGAFVAAVGVYCIICPEQAFKASNFMRKVEPNENGIRMTRFSGAIAILLGAIIIVAEFINV